MTKIWFWKRSFGEGERGRRLTKAAIFLFGHLEEEENVIRRGKDKLIERARTLETFMEGAESEAQGQKYSFW